MREPGGGRGKATRHELVLRTYRQPGAVREHASHRHALERLAAELLQILSERRVELHGAALDERHHRERRAERLGQRGNVEDRVEGHRLGIRHERAPAERPLVQDLVAEPDQDDGARHLTGRRDRLDRFVDGGEVVGLGVGGGGKQEHEEREDTAPYR